MHFLRLYSFGMELNVEKIKRELKRLGWSYQRLADETGIGTRQAVYYYLVSKSLKGADKFAKALDIAPKDLLK